MPNRRKEKKQAKIKIKREKDAIRKGVCNSWNIFIRQKIPVQKESKLR